VSWTPPPRQPPRSSWQPPASSPPADPPPEAPAAPHQRAWRRFRSAPPVAQLAIWIAVVALAVGLPVGAALDATLGDGPADLAGVGVSGPASDDPPGAVDPDEAPAAPDAEEPATEGAPDDGGTPSDGDGGTAGGVGAPAPSDAAATEESWLVVDVVDGDTIDVRGPDGTEERVRIAGIDTPERGECGFGPATSAMAGLVLDERVDLVAGSRDDRDRYGRIIRYVDVGGVDAGLTLIERGLAIARYDSRDGYGRHDREDRYVSADEATPSLGCDAEATGTDGEAVFFENCAAARAAGAAPVRRGDPGYGPHLDRDGDGVGCQ
jgi:micrococcal nuclease